MRFLGAASLLCLFVLGCIVAGWCGLHQDEALFLKAIDDPANCAFSMFHGKLALMIMAYVGTLKAALFVPYLKLVPITPFAVRLPLIVALVVIAGLSLRFWLGFGSVSAVALTAVLFIAHPLFVLPIVMDWGPVGLQLLLSTFLLYAVRRDALLWAGLLAGLMVWDKAVAVWVLTAVVLSAAVFYPARLRRFLHWRVAVGFLVGAAPYLYFRWKTPHAMGDLRTELVSEELWPKLSAARHSLDGSAMLGYLFDVAPPPTLYGIVASVVLLAVAGFAVRRRLPAFFWTATVMALGAMMLTGGAGGSIHHHVLVWPLLAAAACSTLAALPQPRWAVAGVFAFLAFSQLSAWVPYFQAAALGPRREWTDVTTQVAVDLARPGACAGGVFALDWGLTENLTALGRGRYRVRMGADDWWRPELPPEQQARAAAHAADPQACLLEWADGPPYYPSVRAAADAALRQRTSRVYLDRRRRPIIRLFGPA